MVIVEVSSWGSLLVFPRRLKWESSGDGQKGPPLQHWRPRVVDAQCFGSASNPSPVGACGAHATVLSVPCIELDVLLECNTSSVHNYLHCCINATLLRPLVLSGNCRILETDRLPKRARRLTTDTQSLGASALSCPAAEEGSIAPRCERTTLKVRCLYEQSESALAFAPVLRDRISRGVQHLSRAPGNP